VFWTASLIYFIVDVSWIVIDNGCVKSPKPLVIHHVLSAVYSFLPFCYPVVAPKMCYVMTVEVRPWSCPS
jgi:hypothetical protein